MAQILGIVYIDKYPGPNSVFTNLEVWCRQKHKHILLGLQCKRVLRSV